MPLYILDTDHITLVQRGHAGVTARIESTPAEEVVTTVVTIEEQFRGRLKSVRRARNGSSLIDAYARLHATLDFFRIFPSITFSAEAEEHFESLREQNVRIGTLDLRIAATVLAHSGILVTRNARDFSRVPGLTWQDWSR